MSLLKSILETVAIQSLPIPQVRSFRWFNPVGWLSGRVEGFIRQKTAKPNPIAEQERIKAQETAARLLAESQAQAAAELAKTEAAAEKIRQPKPKVAAEKVRQPKPKAAAEKVRQPKPKAPSRKLVTKKNSASK